MDETCKFWNIWRLMENGLHHLCKVLNEFCSRKFLCIWSRTLKFMYISIYLFNIFSYSSFAILYPAKNSTSVYIDNTDYDAGCFPPGVKYQNLNDFEPVHLTLYCVWVMLVASHQASRVKFFILPYYLLNVIVFSSNVKIHYHSLSIY
jgi:hypothetical protein